MEYFQKKNYKLHSEKKEGEKRTLRQRQVGLCSPPASALDRYFSPKKEKTNNRMSKK